MSYHKILKATIPLSLLLITLSGCGGGNGKESTPTPTPVVTDPITFTGQFKGVHGVTYSTSSGISGTTDADGTYSYQQDDLISFNINDLVLGELPAKEAISVFHLRIQN